MTTVAVLHLASTLAMVGVIWFVQVVHYPLLGRLDRASFPADHRFHMDRTGIVVVPPMLAEVATLVLLLGNPGPLDDGLLWLSVAPLAAIWITTFGVQVPLHRRLSSTPDSASKRTLVRSNWIRRALWSIRAGLVIAVASSPAG